MLCVGYLETVDCRIFVIRSPWRWRYTGKVSIWSRYLSNQHFGPWMVTNIIFVAHIERVVIVDANPVQWDAAEKDRIGESSSLPNNSIPPAGPSWLPSYLWQPTKLVRVISGYPEWRLSPAGGRSTSGETGAWGQRLGLTVVSWLSCRALVPMIFLKLSPRIDVKTHWSHLNYFLCGKRKAMSGEKP